MKKRILFLLLTVLPFISGCNNTENVKGLIVGKTWRLSSFYYKDGGIISYPNAKEILENNPDGFYLKFNDNNTFNGKAINCSFSGTWNGNGKTNDFSMTITNTAGSDASQTIAVDFINAVKGAYSYKADENILTIYYSYGVRDESMSFYVKK
jgi:hypothetical protein